MTTVEIIFLGVYFSLLCVLGVYGSHRYRMAFLYYRHKFKLPTPKGALESLPKVTIQLPIFNEMYVVERLVESVCRIDYPRDLLEIQVLDDSTDETCGIARACVERQRQKGHDIVYIHRVNRQGFKAGALENGLKLAKGQFVAVFDADFVPSPDFLMRTVPFFSDDKVGMVQVRWGHLNREFSLLTQAQSIFLDGHFIIEHTARNRAGCFFNFNGTAGIWRRDTISDAGGWQHDTLTEDLDLSYRAQLKGWQFVFLPEVISPAEVPVDMNAFKSQQHRWAKGSIQTAKKLLPTILKSDLPLVVKREAFFHLTNNMAYLLMVLLSVLMPISMVVRFQHGLYGTLFLDLPFFLTATASVCFFYVAAQRERGAKGWERVKYLPFLMSLGIGMAISNAKAVAEALLNQQSGFARTPKTGAEGKKAVTVKKAYRGSKSLLPLVELLFAAYFTGALWFAIDARIYTSVPFIVLFLAGFLYVGSSSLLQGLSGRMKLVESTPAVDAADEQPRRAA
ncbi:MULTISPECIES: cellulose synthase family protein [Myxococcus]|uniref:Glycosyl transferase, group 2 n=2 Tax=Myxococcus xanthus TaxID=34 RepID=Q1D0E6_MYXXD|nr:MULTISPECIES: cellulose synthase family protein [Myxococcus]ABF87228.1 glycosyl transferase, group 2 [Myxococcus xanthus DK 1622]NOJ57735.1 glycosyltransferase [Myxococcus xanthus]NOK02050.1 glycosyltransferase [Myxococcus xanthus]QDE70631.1 glycosyl transferase family 2 [Myxococcus xanthus]QDE77911.1 glycosyl transferase family 2 [Myxococcus xanthus]